MDAAILYDSEVRLCHPSAISSEIRAVIPAVERNLVVIPFVSDLQEHYDSARCDALIWSEIVIPRTVELQTFMCSRGFVKTQYVLQVSWAQPVHEPEVTEVLNIWANEIYLRYGVRYINFEVPYYEPVCAAFSSTVTPYTGDGWSTARKQTGSARRLSHKAAELPQSNVQPPPYRWRRRLRGGSAGGGAGGALLNEQDSDASKPLTVTHFGGPLFILGVCAMIATVIRLVVGLPKALPDAALKATQMVATLQQVSAVSLTSMQEFLPQPSMTAATSSTANPPPCPPPLAAANRCEVDACTSVQPQSSEIGTDAPARVAALYL